jgi:hypothetical protein
MKAIATYKVKVYPTKDKKKLSDGSSKSYSYGAINLRAPQLKEYVGKTVIVKVFEESEAKE